MTEFHAEQLAARVRGEYLEMPGLSLTAPQAGRLWSIDSEATRCLLEALVAQKFLMETSAGTFVLLSSHVPRRTSHVGRSIFDSTERWPG